MKTDFRVAMVAGRYGGQWNEMGRVVRHLAGALACQGEVEVLLAGEAPREQHWEGAIRLRSFQATPLRPERVSVIWRLLETLAGVREVDCDCRWSLLQPVAASLPDSLEEDWLDALGGASAELRRHLEREHYDAVVVFGDAPSCARDAVEAVAGRTRVILFPVSTRAGLPPTPVMLRTRKAADRLVVVTETEADQVLRETRGGVTEGSIRRLRFPVHAEGQAGSPESTPRMVAAGDWQTKGDAARLLGALARRPLRAGPLRLSLFGPGATRVSVGGSEAHPMVSRRDLWKAFQGARAFFDPMPNRWLGLDVLEALAWGLPVVVPDDGGAGREHAVASGGGLAVRGAAGLRRALETLGDPSFHAQLGERGGAWASRAHAVDGFVERSVDAVLGEGIAAVPDSLGGST